MTRLMNIVMLGTLAVGATAAATPVGGDGQLWQRTFRSVSVTEDGQPRPPAPNTRIRIEFPTGGLRADAGCGRITASAAVTDARLVVTGLTLFRNGCADEAAFAQDAWLAAFLDRDPTIELTGHDLVLRDARTRISLTDSRDVATDPPLVGTYWVIEAVVTGGVATALPPFPQPYLVFHADGAVVAYTGCNLVSNSAQLRDGGATLAEAGITKRLCETHNPMLDERIHAALDAGEVTLHISAGRLTVDRAGGPGLLLRSES